MRLLHTGTLEFETFFGDLPLYAILSHTWGVDEVLYEDARHGGEELRRCKKAALSKVLMAAQIAQREKLDYIWIDTCCIDKSSSAELSDAINSMFKWYECAFVCYSYLSDYVDSEGQNREKLEKSRWFSRGWTLQELIAPIEVEFYDATWTVFGSRHGLSEEISRITGIDKPLLQRKHSFRPAFCRHGDNESSILRSCPDCRAALIQRAQRKGVSSKGVIREGEIPRLLGGYGISSRMSWAARRSTTRAEDIAYCLLGIFDVNMPLLYGEGGVRAFQRLQQEIVRHSPDHSLFAWEGPVGSDSDSQRAGFPGLASSPMLFRDGHLFHPVPEEGRSMALSGKGFELDVYLAPCTCDFPIDMAFRSLTGREVPLWLAVLGCTRRNDHFTSPALILEETSASLNSFKRFKWKPDRDKDNYECLAVVSTGSGLYQGWMDQVEFQISFDPLMFKRTGILLHETNSAETEVQCPQASITHSGNLKLMHRYKTRCIVLRDGSEPVLAASKPLSWFKKKIMPLPPGNSAVVIHGTAILLEDSEHDSFAVGWGVILSAEGHRVLEFGDPDRWRSKQARPSCTLWQLRPDESRTEFFNRPHKDQYTFYKLHRKLEGRVADGTWTALSPRDSVTFTDQSGDRLCMEAEVKIEEFLGRARFGISVSMQKIEDSDQMEGFTLAAQ
ncbi:heterokaryon incompatibility protein-domain-containing protein [Schizothecium vesticola]|uniref:Heterokaryon incompatibility protein-domain-containing protein n=1 Tax=Schizothecium vesticola TaxID=314040 RepID=A0AA40K977_9PEZI|nr:heterokaryon incompatibility protein-domain-containing protein [Schizothecium vesticola]